MQVIKHSLLSLSLPLMARQGHPSCNCIMVGLKGMQHRVWFEVVVLGVVANGPVFTSFDDLKLPVSFSFSLFSFFFLLLPFFNFFFFTFTLYFSFIFFFFLSPSVLLIYVRHRLQNPPRATSISITGTRVATTLSVSPPRTLSRLY